MNRSRHILVLFASLLLLALGCTHSARNPDSLTAGEQDRQIVREGRQWLEQHPDDVQARILTGNAAWRLGAQDLAWEIWLPDADRIVARDLLLGRLLIEQAQERGELDLAEHLLAIDPPGRSDSAERARRQQQLTSILQRRHLALDAVQRGDRALRSGELQRTIDFYRRAATLDPRVENRARLLAVEAWSSATASGLLADRPAQQKLDSALTMWPGEPVLYLEILTAQTLQWRGREETARNRLEQRAQGELWLNALHGRGESMDSGH